jgi:phenylacetic acid degradation operon negative regulatory protein
MPQLSQHLDERPLTARSVMASALLGEVPAELPVHQLIRIAALFGINENRARVALSRMVAAGELSAYRGRYRLISTALLRRQERQHRSLAGATGPWNGSWLVAVVTAPAASAAQRSTRRAILIKARMAEQRDGVWLRPDNLGDRLHADLSDLDAELQYFSAQPHTAPAELAVQLWDLDGWAARANLLLGRLQAIPARTDADLAPGFVLSAAVLRQVQSDPLLPSDLLPPSWPGASLRHQYEEWNHRYRALLGRLARPS